EQGRLEKFPRSDAALALRAEDILAKAGIAKPPRYAFGGLRTKPGKDDAPLFYRRWSPTPVTNPSVHSPAPSLFGPPQAVPGSAMALMDPDGRLILLEIVPGAVVPGAAADSAGQADWPALMSAAGYDAGRM